MLDPARSRTFVGRIVFAALCDNLVDVSPELDFVPMLSTGWEWNKDRIALTMWLREDVVFHDGTPLDAEAVAYNLDRSLKLPESRRKSESPPSPTPRRSMPIQSASTCASPTRR